MSGQRVTRFLVAALAMITAGIGLVTPPAGATGAPPTATSDRYLVRVGRTLDVAAPGVLINDTDPEGDSLTAQQVFSGGPYSGTVDLRPDGSLTYVPNAGFEGSDFFFYEVFDGTGWSSAVFVAIRVNGRPMAHDDSYGVITGSLLDVTAPGVLTNDVDVGGDLLEAQLLTPPSHGTARLYRSGRLTYQPAAGFLGVDSLTYRARDGNWSSRSATVTIRVVNSNQPPVATDDLYTALEDQIVDVVAPGVLANDNDPDGDTLYAELVREPDFVDGYEWRPDGSFVLYPISNFDSDVTFTYRVCDGMACSEPATALIDVKAVNDPPNAEYDYYETGYDTTLEIAAPGVLANDSDPVEFDNVRVYALSQAAMHGELLLREDGSFRYDPDPGFFGNDYFCYVVADADPGGIACPDINVYEPPG